jgi:hypothetical protein
MNHQDEQRECIRECQAVPHTRPVVEVQQPISEYL